MASKRWRRDRQIGAIYSHFRAQTFVWAKLGSLGSPGRRQALASQQVEGTVLRDLNEPRGRIRRDAIAWPPCQRDEQRFLHHILDKIDALRAEDARQRGGHACGIMPKEVLDERGD